MLQNCRTARKKDTTERPREHERDLHAARSHDRPPDSPLQRALSPPRGPPERLARHAAAEVARDARHPLAVADDGEFLEEHGEGVDGRRTLLLARGSDRAAPHGHARRELVPRPLGDPLLVLGDGPLQLVRDLADVVLHPPNLDGADRLEALNEREARARDEFRLVDEDGELAQVVDLGRRREESPVRPLAEDDGDATEL